MIFPSPFISGKEESRKFAGYKQKPDEKANKEKREGTKRGKF